MLRHAAIAAVFAAAATLAAMPAHAQDAAAGAKTFVVCRACHQIGPGAKNMVGPELNGVVGRKAGSVPGFSYSEANKKSGITWDEATLTKYLANPQKVVPGTKMIFGGIHDPAKVQDVIAFLKQYDAQGNKK